METQHLDLDKNLSHPQRVTNKASILVTFLILCLLMIFNFADRMIIASLLPSLKLEWALSYTQLGLLGSILPLSMLLCTFLASILVDRWGTIKAISFMGGLWSIATFLGGFSQNFIQILITRAIVGMGEAGFAPAVYSWIREFFPQRYFSLALGLFTASQTIGMIIGVILGGMIVEYHGWRSALSILALPGLILVIILYRYREYKSYTQEIQNNSEYWLSTKIKLKHIHSIPSLLWAYIGNSIVTLMWSSIFIFLPTYLHQIYHLNITKASLYTGGIAMISLFSLPFGGWVMDYLAQKHSFAKLYSLIAGIFIATCSYAIGFSEITTFAMTYLTLILGTFAFTLVSTVPLSIGQDLVPSRCRLLSGTIYVITLQLGAILAPTLMGYLFDNIGISKAFFYLVVLTGSLALVSYLYSLMHYKYDIKEILQ